MSPPTLNRGPLASSSTVRVFAGRSRAAFASSCASVGSRALPVSGRSSVIRQTSPSTSLSTRGRSCVLVIAVLSPRPCRPPYDRAARPRASGAGGGRAAAVPGAQLVVDRAGGAAELVGHRAGDLRV